MLAFGRLSHLPLANMTVPAGISDSKSLRRWLAERWPELEDPSVRVAINQALVHDNAPLSPGDEVAFLPPMSGG